jgi:protein-disulfide isomerase
VVGVLLITALSALGGGSEDPAGASGGTDGTGGESDTVEPLPEDNPALDLARREADDPLALGDADAPVVMIEYADFQDAFVGIYARNTHDRLVEEYVDAGELRIEFRNYPIYGPESDAAARAAWAAGQQGRFWEFREAALADEFNKDSGRFEEESLRRIADEAGVPDVDRLLRDMESDAAGEAVERDATEAYELGITGVPSFLINGHPLSGAQDLDAFRDIIDPLLAAEQEQ